VWNNFHVMRIWARLGIVLGCAVGATSLLWGQQLYWLGALGGDWSEVNAVSANGMTIVGEATLSNGESRAFRWTPTGGMQNLGALGGRWSAATAVSADGSVIAGVAENASGAFLAFRWTASGGMQSIGSLGGGWSEVNALSADGQVIVGVSEDAQGNLRAFRWTQTGGMQSLGVLNGGSYSEAKHVSGDGGVVVGDADLSDGSLRAFRWTLSGGMQELGTLGGNWSSVTGISADGQVVVGVSEDAQGNLRAFRWTPSGGMQDLGALGGDYSSATGVSIDGSVVYGNAADANGNLLAARWSNGGVQSLGSLGGAWSVIQHGIRGGRMLVGSSENAQGQLRAVLWTEQRGMTDLNQRYSALLSAGSFLEDAQFVSETRRFVVGRGYNAQRQRYEWFVLDMGAEWIGRLHWLGTLGGRASMATGVSDSGVVVGSSQDAAGRWRAFRWTPSGGLQALGVLGALTGSYATGVSSDGNRVSGYCTDSAWRTFAFLWQNGQMQTLPTLIGAGNSMATAVSGNAVVGTTRNSSGRWQAVQWNALNMAASLGTLGGRDSYATALAADGGTAVGYGADAAGNLRAFRWTQASGMQPLGTLGGRESIAYGVSADGRFIVGVSRNASGRWQGFRWSQSDGMRALGLITARAVSADGAIIVGSGGGVAMLWDSLGGLRPLQLEYAPLLSTGSTLLEAYAVSPSGRYIVGFGYNAQTRRREAYLLDTAP
jgi:probable HAF family extracellular repeat protein